MKNTKPVYELGKVQRRSSITYINKLSEKASRLIHDLQHGIAVGRYI